MITDKDIGCVARIIGAMSDVKLFYTHLGMNEREVVGAEKQANTANPNIKAMEVLLEWRKFNGREATRDKVIEAMEAMEWTELIDDFKADIEWNQIDCFLEGGEKVTDRDILDVAKIISATADVKMFYTYLGMKAREVEVAEQQANTTNLIIKARAVLIDWRKFNGKFATRDRVKAAMKAMKSWTELIEELEKVWN